MNRFGVPSSSAAWRMALVLAAGGSAAMGDITVGGDVTPDPATSDLETQLYVGQNGEGSLLIDGGSDVVPAMSSPRNVSRPGARYSVMNRVISPPLSELIFTIAR